jgi:hypothetical protein
MMYTTTTRPTSMAVRRLCGAESDFNDLINFIVNLPSSNGFINIIVIVNCLIKMQYIIPIDLINTVLVAEYFIKYIFKLHRLPNLIISDCGN